MREEDELCAAELEMEEEKDRLILLLLLLLLQRPRRVILRGETEMDSAEAGNDLPSP
jgi:hypothetical protein